MSIVSFFKNLFAPKPALKEQFDAIYNEAKADVVVVEQEVEKEADVVVEVVKKTVRKRTPKTTV